MSQSFGVELCAWGSAVREWERKIETQGRLMDDKFTARECLAALAVFAEEFESPDFSFG